MNVAVTELSKSEINHIKKKAEYEGRIYPSKRFGDMVIIEYLSRSEVTIKFINTGNIRKARLSDIKRGEVRDNEFKPVNKVGIMDVPNVVTHKYSTKSYKVWNRMLQRCYNENLRHLHQTYADCVMSDDFKYYSKFKEWFENQIGSNQDSWHLDKDILVKGNKVYSAETCCFVPHEINSLIISANAARGELPVGVYYEKDTGKLKVRVSIDGKTKHIGRYTCKLEAFNAYKQAKENHIKKVADKYKDVIDPRVYEALYTWTISIDD